jgi:tetraacyldisaccharide 4'-kinase
MPGPLATALLAPLSRLYGQELARRNARFDRGLGVVRFDRPVLSVGNLSVGGTGKTPMVALLVRHLGTLGHRPCIAMRGYGASRRVDGLSDEAGAYAAELPGVPVVARPDRAEGLIELFADEAGQSVDAVVLDDGFQHRRIARELDVVLLDATRPATGDALLPLGRLREPMAALARAQAVVVTHAEAAGPGVVRALAEAALRVNPTLHTAAAEHAWAGLAVHPAGQAGSAAGQDEPVSWLARRRVLPVCAIGNPGPFVEAVRRHAGAVLGPLILRDHDPYAPGAVRRLIRAADGAEAVVTTAKDWAKLGRLDPSVWACPVAVPRLELRLTDGGPGLLALAASAVSTPPDTLAP